MRAMDRNHGGDAAQSAERRAFYERIDKLGMTPLWEVLGALVPPQPTQPGRAGALALRRGPRRTAGGGPADHAPRRPSGAC